MKSFSLKPAFILTFVNLVASFVIIYNVREYTNHFKKERNKIAAILNFNERLLDIKEAIPLIGDWLWSKKYSAYQHEQLEANKAYDKAKQWTYILLLINLVYLIVVVLLYRNHYFWFGTTFSLLTLATVFLTAGIFTPLLELEAYKENLEIKLEIDAATFVNEMKATIGKVPLVGNHIEGYLNEYLPEMSDRTYKWHKVYPDKMYFFYENKGLFDVLKTLWKTGNIPIAIVVGFFSFIVPTIKLLFSFIITIWPYRSTNRIRAFINYIAKFSMLDVMVVSIFITFFTFDQLSTGVETSSNILMGIYFFTAYVLTAILSGITLERYLDARMKKINE